ncbi:inverse autotransporter beta domain-containing protein [Pelagibacterales bacterium SAG-MED39]|nr:inverse autotransporter beta domain-containing protein [Pelagibacterales bacterium SAG-MED39]
MKKIFSVALFLIISTVSSANELSNKISEYVAGWIPGEGITEASVELRDNNEGSGDYQFSILGVRDVISKDTSNLFSQFSIHTQEINDDKRFVGNLGLGYRFLNPDESFMFGSNVFYDTDIQEGHKRIGYGLEVKAAIVDFSFNQYLKATNQKVISGTKEQILSGNDYNISSQVPYIPWSTFNLRGYRYENEKASNDQKGYIYSLENMLNPSLQFNIELDNSSISGVKDEYNYEFVFIYPPQEKEYSLSKKAISDVAFEKKNMQAALKDKVRRNNNLTVEIQGSVIFTSK